MGNSSPVTFYKHCFSSSYHTWVLGWNIWVYVYLPSLYFDIHIHGLFRSNCFWCSVSSMGVRIFVVVKIFYFFSHFYSHLRLCGILNLVRKPWSNITVFAHEMSSFRAQGRILRFLTSLMAWILGELGAFSFTSTTQIAYQETPKSKYSEVCIYSYQQKTKKP